MNSTAEIIDFKKSFPQFRYEFLPDSHPDIQSGTRICRSCKKEFGLVKFRRSHSGKFGREYHCLSCSSAAKKNRHLKPEYRETIKRNNPGWNFKKSYGLSLEDVHGMLRAQMGLCANRACGKEISLEKYQKGITNRAFVDHCHTTKKVRGLLCISCNTSLGLLEQKNKMFGLTEYLQKNGG